MSEKVTVEEQRAMGLRPAQPNIVKPKASAPVVRSMSEAESAALQGIAQPAMQQVAQPIQIPQGAHSGHLRDNFVGRATAQVAERFILWDMAIFAAITAAITVLIWYFVDGDLMLYSLGWLVVWGGVSYFAMNKNRGQAYDHSPTGVARLEQKSQVAMHDRAASVQEYEIDSRERIALHAIDRHAELIEKRWRLETSKDE